MSQESQKNTDVAPSPELPEEVLEDDQVLEDSVESGDEPVADADESVTETHEAPLPASEIDITVESVIEAVLFASDEPVPASRLVKVVDLTGKQIRKAIETLNERYTNGGHAFRIEQIAGGYQMLTLGLYDSWLRKLVKVRSDSKLSPAALETLAVVAYKQPVIRADIEAIRGVASGEILRSLMVKGLVKIVGRAEIIGRPMLYGTTKKFLEVFGLASLKDLPTIEELKKPEPAPTPPADQEPSPEPVSETVPESSPQPVTAVGDSTVYADPHHTETPDSAANVETEAEPTET